MCVIHHNRKAHLPPWFYIAIEYCKKLQITCIEHPKRGRNTAPLQVLLACCCSFKSDMPVRSWYTSTSQLGFPSSSLWFFKHLHPSIRFLKWPSTIHTHTTFPSHPINTQGFQNIYSWPCQKVPVLPKCAGFSSSGLIFWSRKWQKIGILHLWEKCCKERG